jgi:hypothetical protein
MSEGREKYLLRVASRDGERVRAVLPLGRPKSRHPDLIHFLGGDQQTGGQFDGLLFGEF